MPLPIHTTTIPSGFEDRLPKKSPFDDPTIYTLARERLLAAIEMSGMTPAAFARHIGIGRGKELHGILRGYERIKVELAAKIHAKFPDFTISWLLNGPQERNEYTIPDGQIVRLPIYTDVERMPLPPGESADGELVISAMIAGGAQVAIAYADTIMNPYLRDALMLVREVSPAAPIVFGNIYLIVTDHFRLFRHVAKNAGRPDQLRLMTLDYEPRTSCNDIVIARDQIRSLWIVCRAISRMIH